jgi:hypothetical protein
MSKIITEKNQDGETIHVKVEKGVVMVHHTDCTEGFITFNKLMTSYILSVEELKIVYNCVKSITFADTSTAFIKAIKV